MYDELVKRLRDRAGAFDYDGRPDIACDYEQAADAIEELSKREADMTQNMAALSLKVLRAEEKLPRWIPVTERLPEERQFVLAWKDEKPKGFICISCWMVDAGWAFKHITHWMPLPQPPKAEEGE